MFRNNRHPEALFWPKDLPRCIGLVCTVPALRRVLPAKSRDSAFKPATLREIPSTSSGQGFRPREGLRMTVFG